MSTGRSSYESELVRFLGALHALLERGQRAYHSYIEGGRTYLYARILRSNNEAIRELILAQLFVLPEEYQTCAMDLVAHIDIWAAVWDATQESANPKSSDKFVFEAPSRFPADSVARLRSFYRTLQESRLKP